MKIKTKKEMNLPELIEWGFRKNIENESYKTNDDEGYELYFDAYGTPRFSSFVNRHDTFEVEIEEEITEDTKLDLVERFIGGTGSVCYTSHSMSIKECLKRSPKECTTTHFYIENEDKELVLIWTKEKGMVE